jgi:DNA-binding transcriptional MerR regulator
MKTGQALWTLDELTAEVATALAEGYAGATSGRVRAVPDGRTIRYYTTLGLIDRPSEMRGRTALYGRRHLLQIVAIKKLQAVGRSLAEIQHELMGRTDKHLADIAGWDVRREEDKDRRPRASGRGRDFWRREPAPHTTVFPEPDIASEGCAPEASTSLDDCPGTLVGVPLVEGVTLLVAPSRLIEVTDLAAIRSAAAPLIDTLIRTRLIEPREQGESP